MKKMLRRYRLFMVYLLVLLIGTVLSIFLVDDASPLAKSDTHIEDESWGIYHVLDGDMPIETLNDYLREEKTFPYTGDRLHVVSGTDEDLYVPIIVDKKENDGIIEMFVYETPTYVNGYEVTGAFEGMTFSLEADTFIISGLEADINIGILKAESAILQFMNVKEEDHHLLLGEELIYLMVPHDVEVTHDHDVSIIYK